ncbi:MAG TPA: hypothetical protein VFX96_17140 [Pyrinomonadaceae bacterium]|nr:hypothetical protein [Pyrinomonadaceae bacterium]
MKPTLGRITLALLCLCASATAARSQVATPTPAPSATPTPAPSASPQPSATPATPQAPPSTDIFLVPLSGAGLELKAGEPRRLTDWEGYDNQPSFTPDGRAVLYTSIRADGQADIYRYDLARGASERVTQTPESEYSPTVTPDGKHFSVIRVEGDGTQRLWKFPLAGGAPSLVLEKTKPVGYHVWADKDTLMLFILGEPVTMQLVDTGTELTGTVATNIGRGLARVPGAEKISYVHKVSSDEWLIKEFDLKTHRKATLVRALAGSEDYAWTPDGALVMAQGGKLYAWRPGGAGDWKEFADLSAAGLGRVTRIAVSPRGDMLAVVAQK